MNLRDRQIPVTVCRGITLVLMLLAVSVAACAPEEEEKKESKRLTIRFTGNPGTLAANRAIVALHLGMSSCGPSGQGTTGIRHTADKDISVSGGPVDVSFTLSSSKYPDSYLETYYIDVDNSNTLSFNDIVLGNDSFDMAAACISTIEGRPSVDPVVWEDLAAAVGSTAWQDITQPFSTDPSGDVEVPANLPFSFIPVERSFSELAR